MSTEYNLKQIHSECGWHEKAVEKSNQCGCFFCISIFPPSEIVEWIDEPEDCPHKTFNEFTELLLKHDVYIISDILNDFSVALPGDFSFEYVDYPGLAPPGYMPWPLAGPGIRHKPFISSF